MAESVEMEDIRRSLAIIKNRASPLEDELLNCLLDMTMLHLSRRLTSAINRPKTLPTLRDSQESRRTRAAKEGLVSALADFAGSGQSRTETLPLRGQAANASEQSAYGLFRR